MFIHSLVPQLPLIMSPLEIVAAHSYSDAKQKKHVFLI